MIENVDSHSALRSGLLRWLPVGAAVGLLVAVVAAGVINGCGSIGAIVGGTIPGFFKDTWGWDGVFMALSVSLLLAALVLAVGGRRRRAITLQSADVIHKIQIRFVVKSSEVVKV